MSALTDAIQAACYAAYADGNGNSGPAESLMYAAVELAERVEAERFTLPQIRERLRASILAIDTENWGDCIPLATRELVADEECAKLLARAFPESRQEDTDA